MTPKPDSSTSSVLASLVPASPVASPSARCKAPKCSELIVSDSLIWCSVHVCCQEDCFHPALKVVNPDLFEKVDTCDRHTCLVDGECQNPITSEETICVWHACYDEECDNRKISGSDFCGAHACPFEGCPLSKEGCEKSENHKCEKKGCKNMLSKGTGFCSKHKCTVEDCDQLRHQVDVYSEFCSWHKCKKLSCSSRSVQEGVCQECLGVCDFPTYDRLARKWVKCTSPIFIKRCCIKHYCSVCDSSLRIECRNHNSEEIILGVNVLVKKYVDQILGEKK